MGKHLLHGKKTVVAEEGCQRRRRWCLALGKLALVLHRHHRPSCGGGGCESDGYGRREIPWQKLQLLFSQRRFALL